MVEWSLIIIPDAGKFLSSFCNLLSPRLFPAYSSTRGEAQSILRRSSPEEDGRARASEKSRRIIRAARAVINIADELIPDEEIAEFAPAPRFDGLFFGALDVPSNSCRRRRRRERGLSLSLFPPPPSSTTVPPLFPPSRVKRCRRSERRRPCAAIERRR